MERLTIRGITRSRGISKPFPRLQSVSGISQHHARAISAVPRIAEVSLWKSLIPKPFRRENRVADPKAPKRSWPSKEWNPATFFIIIFLLIGSMSIQMISLRKNFETFMRRADVRIGLLREVVEKIQRGEEVDVEKALGTGDVEREAAWEELLKEIEKDDATRAQKKQEKSKTLPPSPSSTTKNNAKAAEQQPPTQESPKGRTAQFF